MIKISVIQLGPIIFLALLISMFVPPKVYGEELDSVPCYSNKYALIIAIDKYKEKSWNFRYGIQDATDFQDYLISHANFSPAHVKLITGISATKGALLSGFQGWLQKSVKHGDLVVIYVRARGIDTVTKTSFSGRHESRVLAVSDTDPKNVMETGVLINELPSLFLKDLPKCASAIILDVDFAGTLRWQTFSNFDDNGNTKLGNPLVIVGSTERNQISWTSRTAKNSVFTRELIDVLRDMGNDADLAVAGMTVSPRVRQRVFEQRGLSQEPFETSSSGENSEHRINLAAPAVQDCNRTNLEH